MGNDDFRVNETILESNNLKYINKKRFSLSSKSIVGYGFVNPTQYVQHVIKNDLDERKGLNLQ